MLIRTPEEIFRTEKKDIYAIENLEGESSQDSGMVDITDWIQANLPGTKTELLAPSEYSGIIAGGINGRLRVDFTPAGLQMFCDRWEKDNASVDPRFQCYIYPYQKWFEKYGQFVPTTEKPNEPGLALWCHTPIGFLHHQITLQEAEANDLAEHPGNSGDLWMHMAEFWPDVARLRKDDLTFGIVGRDRQKRSWYVWYTPPISSNGHPIFEPPTATQIRDWFCLPVDSRVEEDLS
jgi:hypothetical protein